MLIKRGKRGQVTLFVIIAIIIIVGVLSYFLLRGTISSKQTLPSNVEAIEKTFLDCVQERTLTGISILESRGGYIYDQKFEPGSVYMPFSSHLDFVGNQIPYWFYISKNNIPKENVPNKEKMNTELSKYIEERALLCDLSDYTSQGFTISKEKPNVVVEILEDKVNVDFEMNLNIYDEVSSYNIQDHDFSINSKLGSLYDSALKIYEKEQKELFLETYGIDFLRLYAPVDGVELTCAPKTWNAHNVFEDLRNALEVNTLALKTKGKSNDYYLIDTEISQDVKFVYSGNWPSKFEVTPNEGSLLISKPVGNQQGLGILGFCYVPYHFVYNLAYPTLIQIYDENEFFQFPVAVVIQGNQPRKSLEGSSESSESLGICEYKNSLTEISVLDSDLKPLESEISFECFGISCDIGKTSTNGSLKTFIPQCHNGILSASSKNYKEDQMIYSSVENGSAIIILNRNYEKNISLILSEKSYSGNAIISFTDSDNKVQTLVYPEMKKVDLSEGVYNVSVYSYKNSSLKLAKTSKEQCVDVSESGVLGILGLTKKECFNVDIPEQIISNAVSGGGMGEVYFSSSDLSSDKNLEIRADELTTPKSVEELQSNYILLESKSIEVIFK